MPFKLHQESVQLQPRLNSLSEINSESFKLNQMKLNWKKNNCPDWHLMFKKATQIQKGVLLTQKLSTSYNTVA